ncbi:response regulator [Candidatus Falkowbacteria bacterium CG_4_9_14_3_um_filter_36_9]|uniref:Response regulatory domain-containing protein n=2 Tax=Candidatus Falkowiibacteriota TaxID=1752728 RepID=A0A1J4T687_9BACT|nr:MAG: hypothetical protein AUJ27_02690 [Candidatus Falkowbacteria bacterium CG1_02_37_44]PIV50552.1 MAG: response regulator [Candidatus Falkowbacteria bacterium CG02_land_8_20_14_3_00_36_14]PIX11221.1 MAG: response regulator [Candidatus Falkowbacteria bacterium CG_4_8_14_3_um_filter_36_11]PJA10718.1 MAG: response regulator [Candidatus Falkowbacteria bacterium CG_4_10_14_0_2_um_filter_36_22]PJB18569.1 MAG: response regulator [Candidatus Falkowbacteria bacterium CG_4_9_14_3_um_filter_36_9]
MGNNKKRILVIEDDNILSSMYKTKLESDNYEVTVAVNGIDGLKLAKMGNYNLILLDIIMPLLDGFVVLEELKKDSKTKNTPVILLTNLGTEEDVEKGKKLGAVDYIVKANMTPKEINKRIKLYIK